MYHLGVDIGGTFTDLIAYDSESREVEMSKVSSTPDDPSEGMIDAFEQSAVSIEKISQLVHGTTVATNAVLERTGATCGLLTTEGFEDMLELGRRDRPSLWGLSGTYEPLIPSDRSLGIDERVSGEGEVVTAVSEAEVQSQAQRLLEMDVDAIVVSFLHSYQNAANEEAAVDALHEVWPNEFVVQSSEVLPEFREFERTSTAAVSAYTQPIVQSYLEQLENQLVESGFDEELFIMQSNGGVATSQVTKRRSGHTLLSGPAAGVTAAVHVGELIEEDNILSCDMGGTSFDVGLLAGGEPIMTQETEIDYQIPIRLPMIDITTIGAGGGSLAYVDSGGILTVGPESAGADPGPVCYGQGGENTTITDANVILQRIDPTEPIGSGLSLDAERAKEVMQADIADPLDLSVPQAAKAVIDVGVNRMVGKIRELSIEQGYDPREFTLIAFGGAGPTHAGEFLKKSDVSRAVIPYYPGVFSAFGCILADSRHDHVQSINESLENVRIDDVNEVLSQLEAQGRSLVSNGVDTQLEVQYRGEMKYRGQTHTISVPFPSRDLSRSELQERFEDRYLESYSESVDAPIVIDNLKATVVAGREELDLKRLANRGASSVEDAIRETRRVYFDEQWRDCEVYDRKRLPPGVQIDGPAILEQADTTTVVHPGMTCRIDEYGNALLEVNE